ncbi:MAG: nucleotidyltransferase family protein [Candidatus Heimdallarchaeota archaeon]|nr:MAG: nucleotidyltransferase family protein [Candidatus Heimdallarchaeota archaeon]
MTSSAQVHNDELMKTGYQILEQCKEESIPCFLWAGGAIYHILGGRLDYRPMSDLEFFLPRKADKQVQQILLNNGFYANKYFNSMQNMYRIRRREFYFPNRELTSHEIEELEHGRRSNIDNVKFQKIELFITGIKMCWTFKFEELPEAYNETLICPPGFQLALKANAIHPEDFDLKDIQDIASMVNSDCCGKVTSEDSIFTEPKLDENLNCSIGTGIFEELSNRKHKFASTVNRNFKEVLNYSGLTESGKSKLSQLIEFLEPFEQLDNKSGILSRARKEKPRRVDARHI